MSVRDLFFRISAQDNTGGAFRSVQQGLRGVEGAARTVRERFAGIGRGARNAGAVMTAGFTAPITLALRQSLSLFQQQENAQTAVTQAIRQTGAAAGFTADELFRQASALQDATTIGDEQILADVTAQLLTFGNVQGQVFERAQMAALDLSQVLGTDLRSTTIQLGKALNDPVRGITALGRAGVQFSDEQKELIKSLVETGRVAEAQGLILEEISQFYGGQASAAAGTLSGQITQLGNAWGDLQEQFGAVLAELLPPIIAGLRGLVSAIQAAPEPLKRVGVAVALVAAAIGPLLGVVGLLTLGATALSAPMLAAAGAVGAVTAGLIAFGPELMAAAEAIAAFVSGAAEALVAGFEGMIATVRAFAEETWQVLTGRLGQAAAFVSDTVAEMGAAFDWLYQSVVGGSSVPDLVDGVLAEFDRLDRDGTATAEGISRDIGGTFDKLASGVVDIFAGMAREGNFSLKGLGQGLLSLGSSVAGGIASSAISTLSGMASTALLGALPAFAEGGSFTIGGKAGRDRNLVAFMGTQGERVTVTPQGQGGGPAVVVNIQTPDPQAFRASQAQLAASLSRAVARGQGKL